MSKFVNGPLGRAVIAVVGLIAVCAVPAFAATDDEIAKLALYAGADREAVLSAGAKKEGEVLVYSRGTQLQAIIEAFKKKYPFVRAELYRGDTMNIARQVSEEYKVGRATVDAFELSTNGLVPLDKAGLLIPFNTSHSEAFREDAWGPNRHWLAARLSFNGVGYNSKAVDPKHTPKSFSDLLDPYWKGKLSVTNSRSSNALWVGTMIAAEGIDYVKKLAQQDVKVLKMSGRALANLVVSGEVPISPTIFNSHVFTSKKKGASIEWVDPGAVYVSDTGVALPKRPPHPNAALLFIDFTLSKEAQALYQSLGYAASRTDMTNLESPEQAYFFASRPDWLQKFEEWTKIFDQSFKKGR